jgi:site-specific DNA recombinase
MKAKRSTRAADPKKAAGYLRVSTTRGQQDLGLSAQRAAIESWAKREGVEVCAWFEEEVSGGASLEKRPVLLQAISALGEHGAGLLVVQRLDRFSRDPFSAAMAEIELSKFGARMVTTDSAGDGQDPASRLMRDVGLAAARFERAMIAARTKAALAVKKARGESTGTPPYGWKTGVDGKTLVADEHERETTRRLQQVHHMVGRDSVCRQMTKFWRDVATPARPVGHRIFVALRYPPSRVLVPQVVEGHAANGHNAIATLVQHDQ